MRANPEVGSLVRKVIVGSRAPFRKHGPLRTEQATFTALRSRTALTGCRNTPPAEAALLDLLARRSQTFALCNLNANSTFFRRFEANFWPHCRDHRHYGRTCASDRMRTRLYAAMFNTNIWSTFFKPRTITWRMRPTVLAQPKPCSINLRFCCEMA